MSSENDKKVCLQCSMHNVFIENSENNKFSFELIPQDQKSMECLDKGNLKRHKSIYYSTQTIDLNDYQYPQYFSKTPVMLLLDDLLGVDIMLIVDSFYSFCSTHVMLRYKLGHVSYSYLLNAMIMCKEILRSSLGSLSFERSMIFTKLDGENLLRIYFKDFDLEENEATVEKIKEAVKDNEIFKKIRIKIRGRCSGYYEKSLKSVSPETTYIQIEGANLKYYFQDIFGLLKNLRESINQENISE